VIDTTGEGFWLTDAQHGVAFHEEADGSLQQMSWTDPAHHNAWLVRPNPDGSMTSLAENMFGNLSPQPTSVHPNGYAALAYLMEQEGCGNKFTRLDSNNGPVVWNELRLWQDGNQDGVAQRKNCTHSRIWESMPFRSNSTSRITQISTGMGFAMFAHLGRGGSRKG
jgi:hypothetical protein